MKNSLFRNLLKAVVAVGFTAGISIALADAPSTTGGIGSVADTVISNFSSVAKFVTASFYITGLCMVGAALFKLKQRSEAPQQIPVTTPLMLLLVGSAFLFTPSLFNVAGYTLFQGGGDTAGVAGIDDFQS